MTDSRYFAKISVSALIAVYFRITLVTFLSMIHIQRRSSQLKRIGLQANSVVMRIYLVLWVATSIVFAVVIMLVTFLSNLYPYVDEIEPKDISQEKLSEIELNKMIRLIISTTFFFSLINILFRALDGVILFTYLKFSRRLDRQEIQQFTDSLVSRGRADDDAEMIDAQ